MATAVLAVLPRVAAAHPEDALVQRAFLTLRAHDVVIELDLTPGHRVAPLLLEEIDANGDGALDAAERVRYEQWVHREIGLHLSGGRLALVRGQSRWPTIDALRSGDGVIHLVFRARIGARAGGAQTVVFQNRHVPLPSIYLSTATVGPAQLPVLGLRRTVRQDELTIDTRLPGHRG
jgi:hypothetical protein